MSESKTSRRVFVVRAAQTLAATQVAALWGCAHDGGGATNTSTATDGSDTSGGAGSSGFCCDGGTSSSAGDGGSSTSAGDRSTSGDSTAAGSTSSSPDATGSDGSGDATDSSGESSSETGATVCEPTPADIEGPFYRPGIPIGGNLDTHGEVGVGLTLAGRVLDVGCQPQAGAIVEIWHASPVAPGGAPGDDDATYDSTDEYRYYGQLATAADGSFEFQTLRPGWYLNGPQYRPAHVHLKVWVGGTERLVTQLYFVGDPFNDIDAWFNPVMALSPDDAGLAEIEVVV